MYVLFDSLNKIDEAETDTPTLQAVHRYIEDLTQLCRWFHHIYVDETTIGLWEIEWVRHFLYGRDFSWITCRIRIKRFFEG